MKALNMIREQHVNLSTKAYLKFWEDFLDMTDNKYFSLLHITVTQSQPEAYAPLLLVHTNSNLILQSATLWASDRRAILPRNTVTALTTAEFWMFSYWFCLFSSPCSF
jgi:hypothetical protein